MFQRRRMSHTMTPLITKTKIEASFAPVLVVRVVKRHDLIRKRQQGLCRESFVLRVAVVPAPVKNGIAPVY